MRVRQGNDAVQRSSAGSCNDPEAVHAAILSRSCNDPVKRSVNGYKPATMKFFTITMAALLLLLGSCKKSGCHMNYDSIVGTWEIRSLQGSIPKITYPPGNDSLLKFTMTNYLVYSKGQLVKSGTYTIVADSSFDAIAVPAGQFTNSIIFDGDTTAFKKFFQITGKTLTIISGIFALDSGSKVEFERITEM